MEYASIDCYEIGPGRFYLETKEYNGDFVITDMSFGTDEKNPDEETFHVKLVTYQPKPGSNLSLPCHTNVYVMKEFRIRQNSMHLPQWIAQDYERSKQVPPHPNILGVCQPFFSPKMLRIIFPFMRIGSIRSLMHTRFPNGFPEDVVLFVLREVLQAVSWVHDQGQVHKDISAGHIFLDDIAPVDSRIRLAFGASVYDDSLTLNKNIPEELEEICRWGAAPEVHNRNGDDEGYPQESDVWLLGVTALELAYGKRIVDKESLVKVVDAITGKKPVSARFHKLKVKIKVKVKASYQALKKTKKKLILAMKNKKKGRPEEESDAESQSDHDDEQPVSKDFRKLILRKCLSKDPSKRPTVTKLLQSTLFKNITMTADECFAKLMVDGSP